MQCSTIYSFLRVFRFISWNSPISFKLSMWKSLIFIYLFIYHTFYVKMSFLYNASAMAINPLRVALNSCVRQILNLSILELLGCQFWDFYKLCLIPVLNIYKTNKNLFLAIETVTTSFNGFIQHITGTLYLFTANYFGISVLSK